MTLKKLLKAFSKNNVPDDAKIMSDSGWECSASDVGGAYYNPTTNTVVLVQSIEKRSKYFKSKDWIAL